MQRKPTSSHFSPNDQLAHSNEPLHAETVSFLIRARRRQLGLTQKELGHMMGIDQRTISALEKHAGSVSVNRLFNVMQCLEINLWAIPVGGGPSSYSTEKLEPQPQVLVA